MLDGHGVSAFGRENVLETGGGDGYTTDTMNVINATELHTLKWFK